MKPTEWPVELGRARLWLLEGSDGQSVDLLFDRIDDFDVAFWPRGSADAVGLFLNVPANKTADDKLLVGIWDRASLIGVLDCIPQYPDDETWTLGMLAMSSGRRREGIGSQVLAWLESEAARNGGRLLQVKVRDQNLGGIRFLTRRGFSPTRTTTEDSTVLLKPIS